MLQFATHISDKYTIPEEVQMALEGGCKWIRLSMSENDEAVKEIAQQIIPLCKDAEAFLLLDNNLDLVEQLRVHGVHLSECNRITLSNARDRLGANAVIGVDIDLSTDLSVLKGLDIDYAVLRLPYSESAVDDYSFMIQKIRQEGIDIHLVASGDFLPDILPQLMKTGISGIELSKSITNAADPVAATVGIIDILKHTQR